MFNVSSRPIPLLTNVRRKSVSLISSYSAMREQKRPFAFPVYYDLYRYSRVCNSCNEVPYSGFHSNFSNVLMPSVLFYAVYCTHSKAQIHVINVRIYHFQQTYGMNCIVCMSSSIHQPITIGAVVKRLLGKLSVVP